jgi:hypothetical protein
MSKVTWMLASGFGCLVLMGVIGATHDVLRRGSRLRRLARDRTGCTEFAFLAELARDGIESRIARTLHREIQDIVRLHDAVAGFPVCTHDDLRDLYRFSLHLHAGYPEDPDLLGLAHDVALASARRFSYDHNTVEAELNYVRTVRDLARWIHALPMAADED